MKITFTDVEFNTAYSEAFNYSDVDVYISDLALSQMWGDAETDDIPSDRIDQLREVWNVAHTAPKSLWAPLSMAQAATRRCIPYKTLQKWGNGENKLPPSIRLMLAELFGKIERA